MSSGIASGNVHFTYAQLEGIWNQAGGNPQSAPMAAAIAMAESSGNSAAYNLDSNGSVDRGLWQINSVHGSQSTYDIMGNARAAVAISNNGTNWNPWTTYKTGAFRQYLQGGVAPDTGVPINGTNAAGNQPGPTQDATLTGANCWEPWNWLGCVGSAVGGAVSGEAQNLGSDILGAVVTYVINPAITYIAGVLGLIGGGAMMIGGMWMIVSNTQTGKEVKSTAGKAVGSGVAGIGLATGQPELMAAGGGISGVAGAKARTIRGQQSQQRQLTVVSARGQEQRQTAAATTAGRIAVKQTPTAAQSQATTRAQLSAQARMYEQASLNYRASLRKQS